MINLLRRAADWFQGAPVPEEMQKVVFVLTLDSLVVGHLRHRDGKWIFDYSEAFKEQSKVQPIMDFPDLDRQYISTDLWPFFALRIPSEAQSAVQEFLHEQRLEKVDEVTMLKKFGHRSVANPFELQPA